LFTVALATLALLLPAACGGPTTYETPQDLVSGYIGGDQTLRGGGGDFGFDRIRMRKVDDMPFQAAMEVTFPEGSASREVHEETGAPEGGAQFYTRLRSGPVDSATLRYRVRFPTGFDFVKGGKLPGLFGGTATAGGNTPDGTDGFSTRYMWRADGVGEVYAYLPESDEVGTSLGRGDWSWPTGRWVEVEQEVVLNTPGDADGQITVQLDGQEVHKSTHLTFRSVAEVQIEGIFFSTFFGGGDPTWATPTTQTVQFADFRLETLSGAG
jgi:hypothetical protein